MTKNKPKHINFQDESDSDFEADTQPNKQQEEYDQSYLIEQKQKLMGFRKNLPIYSGRSKIIEYIRKNEVTIIVGETGSGKTTQIPQYLLEDKFIQGNRAIAVTQPRKVAAVSLAGRVAQEAGSSVGDLVGYSVRFDNCCSERTRIKYVTDGMLLRESLMDPNFDQYSVIILDEAHERTLRTDVLLGLCKEALQKRKKTKNPLKLVVMSATLQADKFSDFFNK
jgi:HrpA-like RNA helicase